MTIPVTFEAATHLYQEARGCTPTFQPVRHEVFDRFCREVREMSRLQLDDEDLDRLVRALRRFRFLASAAPLPFDNPGLDARLPIAEAERWKYRAELIWGEHTAALVGQALHSYVELRNSYENPLLPVVLELLNRFPNGRRAVVVPSSRLVEPVQALLSSRLPGQAVLTVTPQALRLPETYDLLVVVGTPRWMPTFVFAAPRSRHLHVVGYLWCADYPRIKPAFALGSDFSGPVNINHADGAVNDSQWAAPAWGDTDDDGLDWSAIATTGARVLGQVSGEYGDEDVEARLYLLAGGDAAFLECDDTATALVLDLNNPHRHVQRFRTREIEPGMFILLRSGESGDYILPVANELLGEAREECRATQREWKRRLRDRIAATGLTGTDALELVARRLQQSAPGSSEVNVGHLQRWMSDRNISPQSRQHFDAIMDFIGLPSEKDRFWLTLKRIHIAHTRAGFLIKRRLLKLAENLNPGDLLRTGRMDFQSASPSGGGIRLTAYLVELVAPAAHHVAGSQLGRPFPWRDA